MKLTCACPLRVGILRSPRLFFLGTPPPAAAAPPAPDPDPDPDQGRVEWYIDKRASVDVFCATRNSDYLELPSEWSRYLGFPAQTAEEVRPAVMETEATRTFTVTATTTTRPVTAGALRTTYGNSYTKWGLGEGVRGMQRASDYDLSTNSACLLTRLLTEKLWPSKRLRGARRRHGAPSHRSRARLILRLGAGAGTHTVVRTRVRSLWFQLHPPLLGLFLRVAFTTLVRGAPPTPAITLKPAAETPVAGARWSGDGYGAGWVRSSPSLGLPKSDDSRSSVWYALSLLDLLAWRCGRGVRSQGRSEMQRLARRERRLPYLGKGRVGQKWGGDG
ncbi:hypothetical protein FIBSPDRAFT_901473 [Athelia psychrophila]|uniref:Uncharacterized protein n=1 Tax=Athelia psychrophila TaxID=1759441 RepID=A0A165X3G3_9AGAM|nr:hypothetical protein FIBSPDRAFT_901473 [Fibularhizoctonia sp. CBS 109695]